MGQELFQMTEAAMPLPVVNETCVYNRSVGENLPTEEMDFDTLMEWYAGEDVYKRQPGVRLHEISWAVKRERAQTFS